MGGERVVCGMRGEGIGSDCRHVPVAIHPRLLACM